MLGSGPPDFDSFPSPRIVFGAGRLRELGELAQPLAENRRVLLVTDPGLVQAGHVDRARGYLEASGLETEVFDAVAENPTTDHVAACVAAARDFQPGLLIGLGGGSALDTAKGCNFLHTNGGRMQDYWGVGKAARPMLPLIAVPTTAGTGSECQSFALIADADNHRKMACGDKKALPRISLLDPALTVTQPRRVAANTAIDTLVHAVESYVCTRKNPFSRLYARASFEAVTGSLATVLSKPDDLDARGRLQLAAAWGGMSIELSMLGAAHAAANPLTAHFGVIHGEAVGLLLPLVVRRNAREKALQEDYRNLALAADWATADHAPEAACALLIERLQELLDLAGVPKSLTERGIGEADLPALAEDAASQWTATFNPVPLTAADFHALYRDALHPRGWDRSTAGLKDAFSC
jgi:alcohol dehydrogenase